MTILIVYIFCNTCTLKLLVWQRAKIVIHYLEIIYFLLQVWQNDKIWDIEQSILFTTTELEQKKPVVLKFNMDIFITIQSSVSYE